MSTGFTGTQRGMTVAQRVTFKRLVSSLCQPGEEFHHGDCIGADAEAHVIAVDEVGLIPVLHPPEDPKKRAFMKASKILSPLPYLIRNEAIVRYTVRMIATPGEAIEQIRSGTWSTIRLARKYRRPLHVILPDGNLL